jgi:DNA-binding NtrC family response regulator
MGLESDSAVRSVRELIGVSQQMQRVYGWIQRLSRQTYPVLILGEEGTGKELVARSIHLSGPRAQEPFVHVDCARLARTMVESELIGYVKGAFIGASQASPGLLRAARSGTLFLSEVSALPTRVQARLFRILQEGELTPLGSTDPVPFLARVIAASTRDLEKAVRTGTFRADLFFRLNVAQFQIVPLRERKRDIPLLADFFVQTYGGAKTALPKFSHAAMECLLAYGWPGNVGELENCVRNMVATTRHPILDLPDLPESVRGPIAQVGTPVSKTVETTEFESLAMAAALREAHGDKAAAAHLLGISKAMLIQRMKLHGL